MIYAFMGEPLENQLMFKSNPNVQVYPRFYKRRFFKEDVYINIRPDMANDKGWKKSGLIVIEGMVLPHYLCPLFPFQLTFVPNL